MDCCVGIVAAFGDAAVADVVVFDDRRPSLPLALPMYSGCCWCNAAAVAAAGPPDLMTLQLPSLPPPPLLW